MQLLFSANFADRGQCGFHFGAVGAEKDHASRSECQRADDILERTFVEKFNQCHNAFLHLCFVQSVYAVFHEITRGKS